MITIKLPYKSGQELQDKLLILRKEYSNVVRYSYNRLKEGMPEKDIRILHGGLNNIDNLDAWTRQCGILEGKQILTRNGTNKVIFGGKFNFINALKGKLNNLKEQRLLPLSIYGEKAHGNRKFNLDLFNNKITYKHKCKEHYILDLPKLNKNYKQQLYKLQTLNEYDGYNYQIKLTDKYIYFMFEEFTDTKVLDKNKYLGIDLNPEYIGLSVKNNEEIIFTKCFSMKEIIDKIRKLKVNSSDPKLKYLNNKLNTEVLEISKEISKISLRYDCKFIFIEDLTFKGNTFNNRLNKNLWKRNIFINNLEKRCNINNQRLFKINPAYSSFIGNLQYEYIDPINASLEIARRGYEVIIKKSKKFYPILKLKEGLKHQWKETVNLDNFKTWKELFDFIKNLKMRYRVSPDLGVFRKFKTKHSYISYLCN